jgi:hypothetical protein
MTRRTSDLVELPHTFSQLRLMTGERFARDARERSVFLNESDLEALHRIRVLVPFLRVSRSMRMLRGFARKHARQEWNLQHWQPLERSELQRAHGERRLFDPEFEPFRSHESRQRSVGGWTVDQSVYLYSPHQFTLLPLVVEALRFRQVDTSGTRLSLPRHVQERLTELSSARRQVLVAASALEAIYYTDLVRKYATSLEDVLDYEAWRNNLPPTFFLNWLDVSAEWIRNQGAALLREGHRIDPLGTWAELVGRADPDAWGALRGDARIVIEMRILAEILLRYYDHLVRAKHAPAIEVGQRGAPKASPFYWRLERQRPLDAVLTEFGLSPHPSLVLVVEGATELLLVPRVMAMFEINLDEDFIALQSADGVGRDLRPLIAYVAPRLVRDAQDRFLDLLRPPTQVLVVADPEGPLSTAAGRERKRRSWVERILLTLPPRDRTPPVQEQIDSLVTLRTWNHRGDSFEFAHFTDRQLATAILRVRGGHRRRTLAQTLATVERVRARRGNLATCVGGRKLDLADALWPTLHRRIERAEASKTASKIPIIKVLDLALELASELPRNRVVIGLE